MRKNAALYLNVCVKVEKIDCDVDNERTWLEMKLGM